MYHVFLLSLTLATATAEYDFMSGVIWGGPDKGCDSSEGAGQAVISCTLNSGNVTLNVDRSASWLKVTCEENSSFSCSELAEARPHISKYATMNGQKGRQISRLDVDSCRLPEESLVCLLDLVNASSAVLLRLIHCEGKVTARNLDGMDAVKFRMNYIDKNTTTVPYPALSELKSLRSFTLKGGSLILDVQNISLPNLRTLELADGRLEVIDNDVFLNTPNIQTLMLWGNKISKIHENAFKGLHDLVNVSLNSNEISSLPNKIFSHSPLIRRVDLYDNRLVILQKDLFSGLQHLEEVIITSNKANLSLEETFSNLPSLKNLKLETSNIEKLPENLFRNSTSLKTLQLGGNRLENLPPTIFSDQKLVVLNLYDNRISELPAVLFKNQTSMERLDLRKNLINNIPGGLFSDAKNLKVCDLSDNQIELLESNSFIGASNLIELYLAGNKIHYLRRETFEVIPSLEILSLARNNLTISKSMNTIALLPTDEYYNEDYAKTFLHYSMFKSLKYIKILNLSKNNVSVICEDWRQLIGLKKLDLSYNNIDFLSDVSMSFDFSDAVVDVRNNKITTILPPVYNNDTQKPTFILNNNPFTCDCYLYDFIQRYKSTKSTPILQMDSATCASPRSLKNTHISELTPEQLFCDVPCNNCTCKIKPYNSRFVIDCEEMPPLLPHVSKEFQAMNLTNEIHLKRSTQVIPSYYKYVDLSNLNLTTAPSVVSSVELNLTNNHLKSAPLDLLLNNCTLYLSNNPFLCSCNDYENIENLMKYKHLIRDYKEIRCEDGGLVSNVNIETICVARNSLIIGSTVSVIGVILVIIIAIYYKYSTEIRILLRKYHLWWGDEFDHEKEYDAFVSYSHQDENYVVEHLVPNLEGGKPPLKLCVHYRNWVIGDFIPTQIARSVEQSRITIIVLSKHFINSIWGHMEFRTAHGKGKVIILMLDDISADEILDPELKAYIAMNTYVKSKDPLVFDRIRDAVLSKGMNKTSGGLNVQLKDGKLVNVNKDIEVAIQ